MVVPVDETAVAELPMTGGSLAVKFQDPRDLEVQESEILEKSILFVSTEAQAKPFSEFELILHLPDQSVCSGIPARLVQVVPFGKQPGLVLELLQIPDKTRQKLENYGQTPEEEKPEEPAKRDKAKKRPASPISKKAKTSHSLHDHLRSMTPNERARLAARGDRRTRLLLMRDHEPKVVLFLLKNPQLSRQEVVEISRLRTLNHTSVTAILQNPLWAQNEEIRYNLVNNPKTPVPIVLKLLPGLNMKHLRELAKHHGIKERIKQAALRLVLQRNG